MNIILGYGDYSSVLGTIVGGAVAFILNKIYFDKRQHLFTM